MGRDERRVVIITGASAGIGRATADLLASSGWLVVGSSRRGTGGKAWEGLVMDVCDDASVREGVSRVLERTGRLDAVVANAGFGIAGAVEHTPIEEAQAQFETNFFGAARLVREALGPMRRAGGGRVVLVGSLAGLVGLPFQAYYSASKFALEGYGEALAHEVAPFKVAVTLVEPGNVATGFSAARREVTKPAGSDDPYQSAAARALGRMAADEASGALPEQVAATIAAILDSPRPPRRRSAGRTGERAGVLAKRVMPYALFERAARSSFGL